MHNQYHKIYRSGWVALVGAGPGDPGLLTLRGRALLQTCDVVFYDALVDESLLIFAPQAKKISLGKLKVKSDLTRDRLVRLMIREARAGKGVVRLKGGDPFIFGRGAEEALALKRAQISFEVVPGVSAGHAVPAYAGIPLTHRGASSQVVFVTGHEAKEKSNGRINWNALAKIPGTLVAFMSLKELSSVVGTLKKEKLSRSTRISVIARGTTPFQKVVSGTLNDIESKVRNGDLHAPALVVIGDVNRFRSHLKWFEERPLFGERVIVTRAQEQSGELISRLRVLGADVIECPAIEIYPVPHTKLIAKTLSRAPEFDYLIFTSANGVTYFWEHLLRAGYDARHLKGPKLVAIGPATARALSDLGLKADYVPEMHTAQAVSDLLKRRGAIEGKRILLARSDIASKEITSDLKKLGAVEVRDLVIYRTKPGKVDAQKFSGIFSKQERRPYLTFTSASTVSHSLKLFGKHARTWMDRSIAISIGPVTSDAIRKAGFRVAQQAKTASTEGLIEATLRHRFGKQFGQIRSKLSGLLNTASF